MMKWTLLIFLFVFAGCAHHPPTSATETSREPAQAQGTNVTFSCPRGAGPGRDIYTVAPSGEVKYEVASNGVSMEIRGPLTSGWISKNVLAISGRWESDIVCGGDSDCVFHYFSIVLHQKTGAGTEITTHYRSQVKTWSSETNPISCQIIK